MNDWSFDGTTEPLNGELKILPPPTQDGLMNKLIYRNQDQERGKNLAKGQAVGVRTETMPHNKLLVQCPSSVTFEESARLGAGEGTDVLETPSCLTQLCCH